MKLKMYRYKYNTKGDRNIIGDLFIDSEYFCHTLEDEKRADGVKIKHKTAIPPGTYKVVLTRSNRFKRIMPLLLNVEGFSGIRIHGGNDSKDTSGCPLVAFNTDLKRIWGTAEKELTKELQQATDEITIEVVDAFFSYDHKLKKEI